MARVHGTREREIGNAWAEGVHPDDLDRCAPSRPFPQAGALGRHYASRGEGVGLGLFIAKAVARAHGGGLEVNSENDETMFRLVLPRQTPTTLAHV